LEATFFGVVEEAGLGEEDGGVCLEEVFVVVLVVGVAFGAEGFAVAGFGEDEGEEEEGGGFAGEGDAVPGVAAGFGDDLGGAAAGEEVVVEGEEEPGEGAGLFGSSLRSLASWTTKVLNGGRSCGSYDVQSNTSLLSCGGESVGIKLFALSMFNPNASIGDLWSSSEIFARVMISSRTIP